MAKRIENHITGDSAIRQISANLIPEDWTISVPDADYGLDMMIEVVTNNETTGRFFFIQSKGTKDSMSNGIISYPLSVERIRDYSRMELPVLFVYHSVSDHKFWGRWMNSLYNSLNEDLRNQKTVTLCFTEENEISKEYLLSIKQDICLNISRQVALRLGNDDNSMVRRLFYHIVTLSNRYIGGDVTMDLHLAASIVDISVEGSLNGGKIMLESQDDTFDIPLDISSPEVLYYPKLQNSDCPLCIWTALISIGLISSNISAQARRFVLENVNADVLRRIPERRWIKWLSVIPQSEWNSLDHLWKATLYANYDTLSQMLILGAFGYKAPIGTPNLYREWLHQYLSHTNSDDLRGILCYNLANSIRQENMYEASSLYLKAARLKPAYRGMYYWWQEMAGVMYCTGHFSFAERFYKYARTLSHSKCRADIELMIADCMVAQGKYNDAEAEESAFIDKSNILGRKIGCEYILRAKITSEMAKNELGVLSNVDCYNKALKNYREADFITAKGWFLYAWRIKDDDLESLSLAGLAAFCANDLNDTSLILTSLLTIYGEVGYKTIVNLITNSSMPAELVDKFLDGLATYMNAVGKC